MSRHQQHQLTLTKAFFPHVYVRANEWVECKYECEWVALRKLLVVLSQASHWAFAAGRVHLTLHSWRTFGSLMFVLLLLLLLSLFGKLFVWCGQLTRVCCCCIVVVDLIWWVIIMIAIRAVDWLGNKVIRQVWLSVTEVYVCVCAACLERMWVQLAGQLSGAH